MKNNLLKHILSLYPTIGAIIYLFQFTSCASFYLEKCQSAIIEPNSMPVISTERKSAEIRYSLGVFGNTVRHLETKNSDKKSTPGNNVEFTVPIIQSHFDVDYTINTDLFIFSGINLEIGNEFMWTCHAGCGYHLKLPKSVLQCYLALNAYSLEYQATIKQVKEQYDTIFFVKNNSWSPGINIGFQSLSNMNGILSSQLMYGLDLQAQKYCGISVPSGWYSGKNLENVKPVMISDFFAVFMVTPSIGLIKKIGDEQLFVSIKIGSPVFADDRLRIGLFSGKVLPAIDLSWTYCKRRRLINK